MRIRRLSAMGAVVAILATLAMPEAPVIAHSIGGVRVQPPFTGTFNRFSGTAYDASPLSHHLSFGGNVSTDYYGTAGTAVKGYFSVSSGPKPTTYLVSDVRKTNSAQDCGWNVKVSIRQNGVELGWVIFAHLDRPIANGSQLNRGTILGYLKQWPKTSCYAVSTAEGVHTHIEARNVHHYACAFGPATKHEMAEGVGSVMGIGGIASGPQQLCSSTFPS